MPAAHTEFRTTPSGRRARVDRVDRDQHARRRSDTCPTGSSSPASRPTRSGSSSPSSAASSARDSRSSPTPRRSQRADRTRLPARDRTARRPGWRSRSWSPRADVDVVLSAVVGAAGLSRHLGRARSRQDGRAGEQGNARRRRAAGDGPRGQARSEAAAGRQRALGHLPGARPGTPPTEVARVVLTASGGPFRGKTRGRTGERHAASRRCGTRPGRWGRRSRSIPPR